MTCPYTPWPYHPPIDVCCLRPEARGPRYWLPCRSSRPCSAHGCRPGDCSAICQAWHGLVPRCRLSTGRQAPVLSGHTARQAPHLPEHDDSLLLAFLVMLDALCSLVSLRTLNGNRVMGQRAIVEARREQTWTCLTASSRGIHCLTTARLLANVPRMREQRHRRS